MMAEKARIFGDYECLELILQSDNPKAPLTHTYARRCKRVALVNFPPTPVCVRVCVGSEESGSRRAELR